MILRNRPHRCLVPVALIVALVCFADRQVSAQSFRLQPSRLEFEILPGKTAVTKLEIVNNKMDAPLTIVVEKLEITQGDDGAMLYQDSAQVVEFNEHSCAPWLETVGNEYTIPPGGAESVEVRFAVPPDARGDYFSAIGVRSIPNPSDQQVTLSIRMVAFVEISITGRTPSKDIRIGDPLLVHVEDDDAVVRREDVRIALDNTGEVSASVAGAVTVYQEVGGKSRRVMSIPVESTKVLPGSAFDLTQITPRRLPSGKYRLVAELTVDGRRFPSRTKIVDFRGDPRIKALVADALVTLEPPVLTFRGGPAAKRRQYAVVKNDGEQSVQVRMGVAGVDFLQSAVMGGLTGDQLLCDQWVSVEPGEFELKPGAVRRIAVQAEFPTGDGIRPGYYADLVLESRFADGQQASTTSSLVVARNMRAKPRREVKILQTTLERSSSADYMLGIKFGNTGEVDLDATWSARITDVAGSRIFHTVDFSQSERPLLPMEIRSLLSELDVSRLDTGFYLMKVTATYGDDNYHRDYSFEVRDEGQDRELVLTDDLAYNGASKTP